MKRVALTSSFLLAMTMLAGSASAEEQNPCGRLEAIDNNYECVSGCTQENRRDRENWRYYFYEYCTQHILMSVDLCACSGLD